VQASAPSPHPSPRRGEGDELVVSRRSAERLCFFRSPRWAEGGRRPREGAAWRIRST
jgi:hypothetical protein